MSKAKPDLAPIPDQPDPEEIETPPGAEITVRNDPKPGYKTSELYVTIATVALTLLAQPLGLEPDQINETALAIVQWVTAGVVAVAYVIARFKTKKQ